MDVGHQRVLHFKKREKVSLTVENHLGLFLEKEKGHMRKDESNKFYFFEEKGNQCSRTRYILKDTTFYGCPKSWSVS